ncbi:MAG: PaaX family transcriptional regulator C-terminal domain-containing protein [Actinomycetota bacterium]|nr:PaaX family transcriptional regulator C-terminal domain-containing protein [Actinomycetota bacterium]
MSGERPGRPPLSARSLALSTLLGTEPPVLPVRALAALGELFGISSGTMRTALSRMVSAGELSADNGAYRLLGRHLERQASQEVGRHPTIRSWEGAWHVAFVRAEGRDLARRRDFRTTMTNHRFGELRPEVWLRPANLPAPAEPGDDVLMTTGPLRTGDERGLAAELWDLDGWQAEALALIAELADAGDELARSDDDALIPPDFLLSAAVLRHLRADPLLPVELQPERWPGDDLRVAYERFDERFKARLRSFLQRAS